MVRNSTLPPGRPSGVSLSGSSRSMPASHLHPITDVANPVSLTAASLAHPSVRPVITRLASRIERLGECVLDRSEEHTSELQSQSNLVCRLLLEKKKT